MAICCRRLNVPTPSDRGALAAPSSLEPAACAKRDDLVGDAARLDEVQAFAFVDAVLHVLELQAGGELSVSTLGNVYRSAS